ncbi:MAG: PilZ domain-containing protein [Deltaproteobacteria bacterium]|nr:PilZ domain-containing protein [Deltaproteobacteria bacterium]
MQLRETVQRAERFPVQMTVKVVAGSNAYRAELVSLSLSGAFIEAGFPIGTQLRLYLPLPGGEALSVSARVVREGWCQKLVDKPRIDNLAIRALGVGVAFEGLDEPDERRLRDFLELVNDRS